MEGGGTTKCCYSLSFLRWGEEKKERVNLKEVLAP